MSSAVKTAASNHHQPMGPMSVALAVLTTWLWGGTAVSNQYCTDVLPPILLGGLRFGLAAMFMVVWCRVEQTPLLLERGQWRFAWMMGLLLFLQIATFNVGTLRSSSSHASILVNSYILFVAGYEALVQRTVHLRWWQWLGLAMAAAGCLCVLLTTGPAASRGRDLPTLNGDLWLLASGCILAGKIVYTKHSVARVSPGPLILWHDILGAGMFFLCSLVLREQARGPMLTETWIALIFGGLIVSGFCFGANAALLRKHGASQVSVFSFATPIWGVALGVLLRGDRLSIELFLGGILVALGILLVNTSAAAEPVSASSGQNG